MILEKITNQEKALMKDYICQYGSCGRSDVPMDKILQTWTSKKERLFSLFGEQLILKREISMSLTSPSEKLSHQLVDVQSYLYNAIWFNLYSENRVTLENINTLLSKKALFDNIYNGETFALSNGLTIQKGSKTMKAILKIAKSLNITIDDSIPSKHSLLLNQKKTTGTLCLSIHPLDFLTMSDNECGWRSCLSIMGKGDYCGSTVSLMNSPLAIVAYLESSKPMSVLTDYSWNNKKWREVFIVDKDIMAGIKGYPYENEELEDIVLEWLKELSQTEFSEPKNINTRPSYQEEWARFLAWQGTYNDFNCLARCVTSNNFSSGLEINYSGPQICLSCGDTCDLEDGAIVCLECDESSRCAECGDFVSQGDKKHFIVDGNLYCKYCIKEFIARQINYKG